MQNRTKRQLPDNKTPVGTRCIQLTIPDDDQWERQLYSEIYQLALWMLWERDPDRSGTIVAKQWRKALSTWRHCDGSQPPFSIGVDDGSDFMIRQNPDNPCLLESSVNGTDWCVFADISKCMNFGTQAGTSTDQPKPGGGTAQYCGKLNANSTYLLPVLVNTGDALLLNSASGAGWDGGEENFGPLWRVPNGNQFIGGLDVGFPVTDSGDPMPAVHHMKLIAGVGGTPVYLELTEGTPVIIPSGITNAQVWVQVNDSAIGNNQGSYDICVTVTNNADAAWSHVLDFRTGSYHFGLLSDSVFTNLGSWALSQGFISQQQVGSNGTYYVAAGASFTPAAALHLTHLDMLYDLTVGTINPGGSGIYIQTNSGLLASIPWSSEGNGTDLHLTWDGDQTGITLLNFFLGCSNIPGGPFGGGSGAIKGLTIAGIGYDPFA